MGKYSIMVEIRDSEGEIFKDSKGFKIPSINLKEEMESENLERHLRRVFMDFEAITPDGASINIEAYLYNSNSSTWMNMASFYGDEDKFVKH